jgi:hypothetical protein
MPTSVLSEQVRPQTPPSTMPDRQKHAATRQHVCVSRWVLVQCIYWGRGHRPYVACTTLSSTIDWQCCVSRNHLQGLQSVKAEERCAAVRCRLKRHASCRTHMTYFYRPPLLYPLHPASAVGTTGSR